MHISLQNFITKTRLFKYIEKFTRKGNFQLKNSEFFIFLLKINDKKIAFGNKEHTSDKNIKTYIVGTHNLCF